MNRMYLLLIAIALAPAPAIARESLPNIVFFLVDDLGWSDLGCYGSSFYETPNIDRFAAANVRFTQAYAACHVCSPTRASILTGKYPASLQLTDWLPGRKEFEFQKLKNAAIRQHLPLEELTLAEKLRQHGYATAHIGKWHLGEEPSGPLQHGFDLQIPRWNKGWPKAGYHAPFEFEGLEDAPGDYLTDRLTDEALEYIEEHQQGPFFLYLSHFAVHDPIQGRPDLVSKYQSKLTSNGTPDGPPFILEGNPDASQTISRAELDAMLGEAPFEGYGVLPERTVKIKQRQDNVQFAAMVESMDESFGRVLEKLQSLGIDDNTIVIFFSDNGGMSAANFGNPERTIASSKLDTAYATSNLPLRGGKGWLYEGGVRVPLIVHWPALSHHSAICDEPVISIDFYPSLLEMIGLSTPTDTELDGVSFAPLLQGQKTLNREAIYWHFPHYSNHGMQSPGGAIRKGDYKLLEYFENGSHQLFNLRHDPGEQHDVSAAEPELAAELKEMLHAWRTKTSAQMMEAKPTL